jgi:tetratricopeptide (TPR) repeat protein
VLYELLSGQTPYRLKTRSPQDIALVVTREELPRPSTVIGHPSAIRNQKSLRGDLDNIVLMAMRRETARRYRSVEQFSEDIRRHLTGLPVIARRDTLSYRAAKFVRRNKIAISAASLLVSILVAGVVATAWQARRATEQERRARVEQARAERRFNEVRKLANSVLFDYYDAIKALPGATKVRERLVKDALNYLDSLASEAHGDPALQRELAAAYERVGEVRGGESSGSLLDIAGAMESYTKALRIREGLVAANPGDSQARRDLASSHQKIGYRLLDTRDESTGFEHLRKALALYLDLTRKHPADDDLQIELATTRNQLGAAMADHNDFASALEQNREALTSCEKLVASHPQDPRYRRALWSSWDKMGYVLWLQNDIAGAIEANTKALALGEALLAADPINAEYRRRLVVTYQHGGDYRKDSDKGGALEYFRKAATLDEELLVADPGNALTRKDLAYAHKKIADFLVELDNAPEALVHFSKALESYEKVVMDAPADLISQFLVVTCHAGVARMQARLGDVDPALEECRRAIDILQKITGDKKGFLGRAQGCEYLGYAYAALATSPNASASETRQRLIVARDMFRQALNVLNELRSLGPLGANEAWAKEIADEVVKCEKALAK